LLSANNSRALSAMRPFDSDMAYSSAQISFQVQRLRCTCTSVKLS